MSQAGFDADLPIFPLPKLLSNVVFKVCGLYYLPLVPSPFCTIDVGASCISVILSLFVTIPLYVMLSRLPIIFFLLLHLSDSI